MQACTAAPCTCCLGLAEPQTGACCLCHRQQAACRGHFLSLHHDRGCTPWSKAQHALHSLGSVAGTFTGVDKPGQQPRHLGLSSNLHTDVAHHSMPIKTASAWSLRTSSCSVLMWASFDRLAHACERLRASVHCNASSGRDRISLESQNQLLLTSCVSFNRLAARCEWLACLCRVSALRLCTRAACLCDDAADELVGLQQLGREHAVAHPVDEEVGDLHRLGLPHHAHHVRGVARVPPALQQHLLQRSAPSQPQRAARDNQSSKPHGEDGPSKTKP